MEIRDRHHNHIPVYTDGSRDGNYVACATVFPLITVTAMRLNDSASIKSLEQITKLCCFQINSFYRPTFVSPSFTIYDAGTSFDWDGDTKVCLFTFCNKKKHPKKKPLFFVGCSAIMGLGVMKGKTLLPNRHWICLMPRLVYPIMILNTVSNDILFSLGKMIEMVRLRTSFVLSSQSSYRRCRKDEVILMSYQHRSYASDSFIYLDERSSTSM